MRSMVVVGVKDAVTEAICFRFSQLGYRVAIILPDTEQDHRQWTTRMRNAGCDLKIIPCDLQSASTFASSWKNLENEWQVEVLVERTAATQHGVQAWRHVRGCKRIIRIVEKEAQDRYPGEQADAVMIPAATTRNTIYTGHVGHAPDAARTARTSASIDPDALNKRAGTAYEIAVLAAFLASDEAAHINGATIGVYSGRYLS